MSDVGKRVGVFVGAFVLALVVGSVALGAVGGGSAPAVDDSNASAFNTGDAVAEVPEESGEISMSEDAEGKVVVIDTTYSSGVTPETVAPMANTLTENGATVRYSSGGSGIGLNSTLSDADAYILIGASAPISDADAAGLQAFTDAGGRVVLMNEPQRQAPASPFGGPSRSFGPPKPLLPLTSQYGLSYDNGYLYNVADNDNNYRTIYGTPAGNSALTDGVNRVVLHESVGVNGGQPVVTASEGTTQSTTRQSDTYTVLTRSDNLVAVGDSSIVDEEWVYRADNEALVGNLLDFLVAGEKSPEDAPGGGGFGGGGFGSGSDGGFGGSEPTPSTATPIAP
jgi:hypothetical protein